MFVVMQVILQITRTVSKQMDHLLGILEYIHMNLPGKDRGLKSKEKEHSYKFTKIFTEERLAIFSPFMPGIP